MSHLDLARSGSLITHGPGEGQFLTGRLVSRDTGQAMSQENVETARRAYAHFKRTGDVLGEMFHPEYVLDMSNFRGWPDRQTYRGVGELRTFLAAWLEAWDDYEFEVEELHDAGDKVVAVLRESGRSKGGGCP